MMRNVYAFAALVVAPMLIGFVLGERVIDINEESIFDADNLLLHLQTDKRSVLVQLEEHALPETPVFLFGGEGKLIPHDLQGDETSVRFFKDTLGRGNFILQDGQMRGFVADGADHVVLQPVSAEERYRRDAGNWHVISRRDAEETERKNDVYPTSPDLMRQYEEIMNKKKGPTVRTGSIDRYVELLCFIDSEVYEQHRRSLGVDDKDKILTSIKLYFSQIVASMDDRYRLSFQNDAELRLSIVLKGLVISTVSGESPWTEGPEVQVSGTPLDGNGKKTAWADTGLDVFRKWLAAHPQSITFDYALFFSGRNLAAHDAGLSLLGVAPLGGICTEYATGAGEDLGGFESAGTVAHELGHNLGARHDGDASSADAAKCPDSDNYLMAPSTRSHVNQYVLSSCSKVQMKKLILDPSRACLINQAVGDAFAATVVSKYMPGQLYSIQERCKSMLGAAAEPVTYDIIASNNIDVCLTLACFVNPQTGSYRSSPSTAPNGTPCGSGKWCQASKCVADAKAPVGTCFMGDVAVGDNSGYFNTCPKAIAPLLAAYGKKTSDELCTAVPDFAKNCCRTCKVPGGSDPATSKNVVVLGTALPTSAKTTAGPVTQAPTAATTKASVTSPVTTKATATTVAGCQDHPSMGTSCSSYKSYCGTNTEITVNGASLGLIDVACRKSCGKC